MLAAIEADGARWGIVTNKPEYLARQVLPAFGWDARSAILVGGVTLAERKPHPLPLLHSAQVLGIEPFAEQRLEGGHQPFEILRMRLLRGPRPNRIIAVEKAAQSRHFLQIGRASGRERVCQYVYISVVAVSFKKKNNINN